MEELSARQYARLSAKEREEYLQKLLETVSDSSEFSVSGDEDYVSQKLRKNAKDPKEFSDNELDAGERDSEADIVDDDSEESDGNEGHLEKNQLTSPNVFVSKDGTSWNKTRPTHHQTPAFNIIREKSGPHRSTTSLSIIDTFRSIFTDEMIDIIVRCTNKKASSIYQKYNHENPSKKQLVWTKLTAKEFHAFLGILITSGVNNSNKDHTVEMWKTNSYPLYRASMSLNRFWNIIRFIRFDNQNSRVERLQNDKAAAIRDLWTMLNHNLVKKYKPTENLTVDEQLFPYRGRTRFTQYIPSKPAKYGIKIWWVCDAKNYYPLNGQIYTGKTGTDREINQGERVVKDLAAPFKDSGRNITMDNFFSSLSLAKHLLSWKLTMVGTLKRNKPYIPQEMRPCKSRQILSTEFGFHDDVSICSYVPKRNKAVILISTMHHDKTITGPKEKPEMIQFYNKTKSGVDIMDQLLGRYTTHRRTSRWPLALFFNILGVAALAAYIIHSENNDMVRHRSDNRRLFLRELGETLSLPAIRDRSQNIQAMRHFSTKSGIESVLKKSSLLFEADIRSEPSPKCLKRDETGRMKVTGVCQMCLLEPQKRRRKTRKSCKQCGKPVCDVHSYNFCYCKSCPNM